MCLADQLPEAITAIAVLVMLPPGAVRGAKYDWRVEAGGSDREACHLVPVVDQRAHAACPYLDGIAALGAATRSPPLLAATTVAGAAPWLRAGGAAVAGEDGASAAMATTLAAANVATRRGITDMVGLDSYFLTLSSRRPLGTRPLPPSAARDGRCRRAAEGHLPLDPRRWAH